MADAENRAIASEAQEAQTIVAHDDDTFERPGVIVARVVADLARRMGKS